MSDNIFKKFFGSLGKTDESVVGIDLGSSAIKVVQLRKKNGRAVLETYGELALGPYANVEIGRSTQLDQTRLTEALVDLLRESHVTTPKAGLALPLPTSLVSIITMPAVDEQRLAQMIPLEARKYIPVPVSEVVLDWTVIPRDNSTVVTSGPVSNAIPTRPQTAMPSPEVARALGLTVPSVTEAPQSPGGKPLGQLDVLVVAIHNDVINRYQALGKAARLEVSFFEIEVFSTMRSILDQDQKISLVFDMGAATTKLYVLDRGIIRFSHIINRGSQDLTLAIARGANVPIAMAEKLKREQGLSLQVAGRDLAPVILGTLDYIMAETTRVVSNYQRRFNKTIGSIVLSGGGVNLIGFEELAQKQFQIPVFKGNPFRKVETPAFLEQVLEKAGPEFAVALGVALRRLQESD